MCIYVCVCGCLDKYISIATWPPKQKFLAPPLQITKKNSDEIILILTLSHIRNGAIQGSNCNYEIA